MRRSNLIPMLSLLLLAGCVGEEPAEEPAAGAPAVGEPVAMATGDAYLQEVEQWRQDRHERLAQPDGWFSLVGLFWLEDGDNVCGSDPPAAVRLPESGPAHAGVFRKTAEGVELEAEPGAGVLVDGQEATAPVALVTDAAAAEAEGEPTTVEVGTVSMYLIDRGGRIGVRMKDSQSPALLAFEGLENYPVDPSWRVEARFVPYDPPKQIKVPNVLGTISDQPSPGAVEFALAGSDHKLDVLSGGDDEYFLVFGDVSNRTETYGGGRFLYSPVADASGRVVLDFNQAVNPPCAFTPYATCPLPPRQNRLEVAILAGEKKYAGGVEH